MIREIAFALPPEFLQGWAAGDVVRYGAILKDAATGRIVGHLQESGVAQSLLSHALSSVSSPLSLASSLADTGSNVYAAVQVQQLKALVETLQVLQVATLGVSLVGVGVSAAGFLYMRKRFNSLDSRFDKLLDAVNAGFERQEELRLRDQMSRTKALVQRAELAGSLIAPANEYRDVAARLAEQAAFFGDQIDHQMSAGGLINHRSFWLFAQLWLLCNSVRLDCQIRSNELLNAQRLCETVASDYQRLFEQIGPASFDAGHDEGRATVKIRRDVTDAAHSKPFLLDFLRTRRVDGPTYLDSLEREKQAPMLVLPAT